jgi:hypothetical protein
MLVDLPEDHVVIASHLPSFDLRAGHLGTRGDPGKNEKRNCWQKSPHVRQF